MSTRTSRKKVNDGKIHVFLSHKKADEEAARGLKKILETHTGRLRVNIFESTAAGKPWEQWIMDTLKQSSLLLLLYTDPSKEWDWCMYEAGLFTPLTSRKPRPVVCLHHPRGDRPRPLRRLTAVAAEKRELVEKFLGPLYRTNQLVPADPPLHDGLSDAQLEKIASEIAGMVCPQKAEPRYYLDRMKIQILDPERVELHGLSDDTSVTAEGEGLRALNFAANVFTWGELRDRAQRPGYGTYWIDELEGAIKKAVNKQDPPILTSTFRGLKAGRIYRPILYREDRIDGCPQCFYVAFSEELEPELVGGQGRIPLMFNLLRLAMRFRFEVIDPFLARLQKERSPGIEDVRVRCRELLESIVAIEDESQRHKHLGDRQVIGVFAAEEQSEIQKMLIRWVKMRDSLFKVAGSKRPNRDRLLKHLEELSDMNDRFMSKLSLQYHRLLDASATREREAKSGIAQARPTRKRKSVTKTKPVVRPA